jgi:hypothetical protein
MFFKVRYSDDKDYHTLFHWCNENCEGNHYGGHDWTSWKTGEANRMIEFDKESDAVLFALRWV